MEELRAPLHAADSLVEQWLTEGGYRQGFAPACVLVECSLYSRQELEQLWAQGAWMSWLGGPALDAGAWPSGADGRPLVHLATLTLEEANLDHDPAHRQPPHELLPASGFLEIFHDLETWGWEPANRQSGGWLVRYLPAEPRLPLVSNPVAEERAAEPVFRPVVPWSSFSLPAASDLSLSQAEFEAYQALVADVNVSWQVQRGLRGSRFEEGTTSHLYGFSSRGLAPVAGLLVEALGCETEDLVLLAEFEGWEAFPGWFGDAGCLEVWMRRTDLAGADFSKAWCLIRTD